MSDLKTAKRLARLEASRARGAAAEALRGQLEPWFAEREQAYRRELVARTRADGRVYEAAVWKLVALDDTANDIDNAVYTGSKASQSIDKLNQSVGGDE